MRWSKTLDMVEVHAEGEVGAIVTGGVLTIPGATMADKMHYINTVDDSLRRFVVYEPRGKVQMSVNILMSPCDPRADAAFLILQADRAHSMSGSNTICVVTGLLETGILPMKEPETVVMLDTPAGLVRAVATCANGKCERVTLDGSLSFVEQLDVPVQVDGYGEVRVDLAYGGCYYALIDPQQVGLRVTRDSARALVDAGTKILQTLREKVNVRHPEIPSIDFISYLMFTDRDDEDPSLLRGCTVLPPGRVDRSPCGTGNSARLACMYARGEVQVGQRLRARSVIDSEFQVELISTSQVGGRPAVQPRISGRGWVYGFHRIGIDPTDPYPLGFTLSDTWGDDLQVTL